MSPEHFVYDAITFRFGPHERRGTPEGVEDQAGDLDLDRCLQDFCDRIADLQRTVVTLADRN